MCIIIVKNNDKVIKNSILKRSADINPDGLGVIWLDTFKVEYFDSSQFNVLKTKRQFIAHFRYATVGAVDKSNLHPFKLNKQKKYLFHNGTINFLGDKVESDTRQLAVLLDNMQSSFHKTFLGYFDSRFVLVDLKTKTFEIFNRKLWIKDNGVLYSKANVLDEKKHLMAVYGTLKRFNSNYYHYLKFQTFVGSGKSVDKLKMVSSGIPYVLPKDNTNKGHHINVDVFSLRDKALKQIDLLEGHPNWYERKKTKIRLTNGSIVSAWLYFNDSATDDGNYIQNYKQHNYKGSLYSKKSYTSNKNFNSWSTYQDEFYCGCTHPSVIYDNITAEATCKDCNGLI